MEFKKSFFLLVQIISPFPMSRRLFRSPIQLPTGVLASSLTSIPSFLHCVALPQRILSRTHNVLYKFWPFSYLCLQPPFLPPLTSHFIYILGIPKKLLSLGMRFILWCFSLTSFQPGTFSPISFASAATPGSSPQGGLSRCPRPGSVPSPLRPELCSPTILSPPLALEYSGRLRAQT